jgi:hypothetical protein
MLHALDVAVEKPHARIVSHESNDGIARLVAAGGHTDHVAHDVGRGGHLRFRRRP